MWIPFNNMPTTARVWIYAAERPLTPTEQARVVDYLKVAVEEWRAHGVPMKASFDLAHGQLVILAADESLTAASGCSIDASTRWFKALGEELGLNWFDRSLFYIGNDQVLHKIATFSIKKAVAEGVILADTLVFPAQVDSIADWKTWPRPAVDSPLRRYFETVS